MHGGSFYLFLLQHDEVPLKETASKEIDESDIDSCAADGNNVIAWNLLCFKAVLKIFRCNECF